MTSGYSVVTGAIALAAATAKSALGVIAAATGGITLVEFGVSFDGTSAAAVPVLVELCATSAATAGTGTAFTPVLLRGDPADVAQATAAVNYTAEPTVLAVLKQWLVSPTSGLLVQAPLGREIVAGASATARKGLVLRLTAPAAVNARCYAEFEE